MVRLPIYTHNNSFNYDIYLEDVSFRFDLEWNEIAKTYLCSMKKEDEYIFYNQALVPGVNFLASCSLGYLDQLMIVDMALEKQEEPKNKDDFKERYQLIYKEKNETV